MTVQFPVVDVRPLVAGNTYCDLRPNWPVPAHRFSRSSRDHHCSNYVRGLGAIRLRFDSNQASAKVAYRYFYTDGIVGRLEICVAFRGWNGHRTGLMSHYAIHAPTWLRGLQDHTVPLMDFGPRFAAHLLDATAVGDPVLGDELLTWWELQEWVVRAEDPAVMCASPVEGEGWAQ